MKIKIGIAGILLVSLLGMPSAHGQTAGGKYPVSICGLTSEQSLPANLPADDAAGWVDFRLPSVTDQKPWDTINKTFLSPEAAPAPFSGNTAMDVTLYPIGFDFNYGGRTMTHFGLTGHGLIYLGARAEGAESTEAVVRNIKYTTFMSPTNFQDGIFACPRFTNMNTVPSTVIDAQTKIRYYVHNAEGDDAYLLIRYQDLLVQHTRSQYGKDPVLYNVRWSSEVILHKDGRVQSHIISADIPERDPDYNYAMLYFGYGLCAGKDENCVYMADWSGNKTVTKSEMKCVDAENADNLAKTMTFTPPAPCAAPEAITAAATFQNVTASGMNVRSLNLTSGVCDGWLVLLTEHNDAATLTRPVDGMIYSGGNEIGGYQVRAVGSSASPKLFSASGLKSNQQYYVCIFPYNDACLGGPVYGQPYFIEAPKTEQIPQLASVNTSETSVNFTLSDDWPADAEILVGMAERDYGPADVSAAPKGAGMVIRGPYTQGDVLYEDASADQGLTNGNHGPYKITAAYVGKLTDRSLSISDLKPNTSYYFYFWKRVGTTDAETYEYVSEYTQTGIRTTGTVSMTPLTFSFSTDRASENAYNIPAGWASEQVAGRYNVGTGIGLYDLKKDASDTDEKRAWGMNLYSPGKAEPVSADFISPWFKTEYADIDVYYYVNLQSYFTSHTNETANFQKQLATGDVLTIDYQLAGETTWTKVYTLDEFGKLDYGNDNIAVIKTSVKGLPTDKNVRLRIMFTADNPETSDWRLSETFVVHHIDMEPTVSCVPAEDLAAIEELTTYRTVALSFTDKNPLSSTVYSYRIEGEEAWSIPEASLERRRLIIRNLKPQKTYEVALRLVCHAGDTSVVKMAKVRTTNGLPYEEALHHIEEVPTGIGFGYGNLPVEKQEPAHITATGVLDHIGFGLGQHADNYKTVGTSFALGTGTWLMMQSICLEDYELPAEFSFIYRAQRLLTEEEAAGNGGVNTGEVDAESGIRVMALVSTDGSFRRADSVGLLTVKDMKMARQAFTIDLSGYKGRIYVALYAENPDADKADYNPNVAGRNSFIVDSLDARYTDNQPCDQVTEIRQSDITTNGITLSWKGYSLSYGIRLVNLDTEEERMVYTDGTTYTFDDLEQGTRYIYFIQGYCEENHRSPSAWSEESFFMTLKTCMPPTGFEVLETTWQSVRLAAISGTNDKVLHIWSKENPALSYTIPWEYGVQRDTVLWYGLYDELNITYCAAVRAVCAIGDSSDWTEPLEFTTKPAVCGSPTNLTCMETGPNWARLNWEAGENNEYFILLSRPSGTTKYDTVYVDKTPYRLVGLLKDKTYSWQVKGVYDGLLSRPANGPEFTTGNVAVESAARFAGLKVASDHGRIAIYNTDALPLDRVEVYGLNGQRLYVEAFGGTTDHLLLPVLNQSARLVLVRIFSSGESATYKLILM